MYFLPGAVMQSIMIGGGYGTGREISEYFTQYGMGRGLLGLCVVGDLIFAGDFDVDRVHWWERVAAAPAEAGPGEGLGASSPTAAAPCEGDDDDGDGAPHDEELIDMV